MSRLRQAFSVFWYSTRWLHLVRMLAIVGFGLFLIGGGIYSLTKSYLPDKPTFMAFGEVMELIKKSSPRHITFEAELDFSKKIYWTGWIPYWGNCPPDQTYQLPLLDSAESEFTKLLGCTVTVKDTHLKMIHRLGRDVAVNGKVMWKEHKTLAQINDMKGRIWVESPLFQDRFKEPENNPDGKWENEKQWLDKAAFTGVLATYEQVMKGLPEGFPRKISSGIPPLPNAFIIQDGSDTYYDERPFEKKVLEDSSSHYWVPVKGSRNSIFVWVTSGFEQNFNGSITGVLQPYDRSDYKTRSKGYNDFSVVMGEALPVRYGLIQYRTAAAYNDAEHVVGWPFVLFGSLITGAGLLGLIVYIAAPRLISNAWMQAFDSMRKPN